MELARRKETFTSAGFGVSITQGIRETRGDGSGPKGNYGIGRRAYLTANVRLDIFCLASAWLRMIQFMACIRAQLRLSVLFEYSYASIILLY